MSVDRNWCGLMKTALTELFMELADEIDAQARQAS
jgi:hypothetical protein